MPPAGTSAATKILAGLVAAVQLISENPYRLARDIRGISLLTADQIGGQALRPPGLRAEPRAVLGWRVTDLEQRS